MSLTPDKDVLEVFGHTADSEAAADDGKICDDYYIEREY